MNIETLFVWLLLLECYTLSSSSKIQFPASMTVVRQISTNLNLTLFMNGIGYTSLDKRNNTASYNIISLDGFVSTKTQNDLTSDVSPLAMWSQVYSRVMGSKQTIFGTSDSQVQQHILKQFHETNQYLIMNAFSKECPISISESNSTLVATAISSILGTTQLDGVNIQFQDYYSVVSGKASEWLLDLLINLKNNSPNALIILTIPATLVGQIDLMKQQVVNSYVDLFVFKYYDLQVQDYTTYNSLFVKANYYQGTSLLQILTHPNIAVDICKTLIAKPSENTLNRNIKFYIDSPTLNQYFMQAYNAVGWFGGYANLDFQADLQSKFQAQVLSGLRDTCYRSNLCTCKLM